MDQEREIKLIESVARLEVGQKNTDQKLDSIVAKFDAHLANYSDMKFSIGKITATVTIILSILFAGVKEAIARLFNGN